MDLIDDEWVPVGERGCPVEVSLVEALVRAHELDGMAEPVATVRAGVLRQMLLPVLLDALGAPRTRAEWGARRAAGRFDEGCVREYLTQYRDRFQLFDEQAPFGQVGGLTAVNGEEKPVSGLVPSIPAGNNSALFASFTEADAPWLSPADALRWLLNLQCWDTAGTKTGAKGDPQVNGGKTTGNPVAPLGRLGVVIPTGRNLFETLLLNTPIVPDGLHPDDAPQWRRPPLTPEWTVRAPAGLLDALTFPARRARLIPDEVDGRIVVRAVVVTAGDRLEGPLDPALEPHTLWAQDDKQKGEATGVRPRRHRPGRSSWQGLDALRALPGADTSAGQTSTLLAGIGGLQGESILPDDYPLGLELVGVEYGTRSAVVEAVIQDAIPFPVLALRADSEVGSEVDELARIGGELVRAVDALEGDLCRARGGELVPWDKGQRASTRLVHILDRIVRRALAALRDHPEQVDALRTAWHKAARHAALYVAEKLLSNLPASAHAGRTKSDDDAGTSRGVTWRVATAELRFRRRLNEFLPAPEADDDQEVAAP